MKIFDTIAELALAKLQNGQFVSTGGNTTKGDGGGETYLVSATGTAQGDITLANSNVAVLQRARFPRKFPTLSDAVAAKQLQDGDVLHVEEHSAGNGGPGIWHVVLTSTVIPNAIDIVISTGNPLLSLMFELTHPIDLTAIGVVPGVDYAAIATQAVTHGFGLFLPGNTSVYTCSTFIIDKPITFGGEGMGNTITLPITGNSTVIVATDNVEVSDMEFRGKTGTGQAEIFGSCIEFDAVTNDPAFARHMEGCKIERVKFRNIKMDGILVSHLLRESHFRECRFVGVGDRATGSHGIRLINEKGTASNINNLWIVDNMFFRFNNEAIKGYRSPLLAGTAGSFSEIKLRGNLIHGQLIDEGAGVEPEETNHVTFEDSVSLSVTSDNNFTSIHPLFIGLSVNNVGLFGKSLIASNCNWSVKGVVDGVTYNRDGSGGATLATGAFIRVIGSEAINIDNNQLTAGTFVDDIILTNGDYTSTIDASVVGNTSQAGDLIVDAAGLGTFRGRINDSVAETSFVNRIINSGIDVQNDGNISVISGNNNTNALKIQNARGTTGVILGSASNNQFQINSSGGTALIHLAGANSWHPGADGGMKLGLSTNQWSEVNSLKYSVSGVQVVGARATGWTAPTGTATRTTFVTSTVTTEQLAERVKALIDDLTTHGLIGS